jgi:hypothetical protein
LGVVVTAGFAVRGRRWLASLVVCAAFAMPRPALALDVKWEAVSGCPTQVELMYRIQHALGVPLEQAAGQFNVRATRAADGYEARLEAGYARGATDKVRLLRAADCDKLADMVSLAIALALGAEEPANATTPAMTRTEIAADVPPLAATATTSSGPDLGLGVWMVADSGAQPRVAVAPSFALQTSWTHVQLRASVVFFANQEVYGVSTEEIIHEFAENFRPNASVRARMGVKLVLGNVLGCGALWGSFRGEHALALCGGWEIGNVNVKPRTQLNLARSSDHLWLAPSASAGGFVAVPNTSLRVGGTIGVTVPVYRNTFTAPATSAEYRAAAVPFRASLGLDWLLW